MNPWTALATRTVSEVIPAPVAEVHAFYVDLDNIKQVHPLVVDVRSTGERDDGNGGYTRTYRITDRIPLGPLRLRTRYGVTMNVPAHGDVIAESRQFPGVHLHTVVAFEPTATGTQLTERMQIRAPRPLLALTVREAVAAHTTMLSGIRSHFQ